MMLVYTMLKKQRKDVPLLQIKQSKATRKKEGFSYKKKQGKKNR